MSPGPGRFGVAAGRFVRALWDLEVEVLSLPDASRDVARQRPRFQGSRLWLPASPVAEPDARCSSQVLAAAAHIAAHLRFGSPRFQVKALKPAQIAIISLLEDARVEHLAVREYPGLVRLWAPFFQALAGGPKTSGALLARLSRALHDDRYVDDDAWVSKGRALFFEAPCDELDAARIRLIGSLLGNDLGQMRLQFKANDYVVEPPYRDDNIGLWQFEDQLANGGTELESDGRSSEQAHDRLEPQQRRNRAEADTARASAGPVQGCVPSSAIDGAATSRHSTLYGEWDYVIQRERPHFCTVHDALPRAGDVAPISGGLAEDTELERRLKRAALRLASPRVVHERRLRDGDRLDMPAAVSALVARARGARPDSRVYRRLTFRREPPALLLLLDLSESQNFLASGANTSRLSLARTASTLLANTLSSIGADWAIHGFSSNGRHEVAYYRFKDFDQPYDECARARLAAMHAQWSTRIGTALRHAGQALAARRAEHKLLLVVTDGEPSDVDVHDREYLLFDAKHATLENRRRRLKSFCLGLDPSQARNVRRMFGAGNYLLLHRLGELPQTLSELYLRLAG